MGSPERQPGLEGGVRGSSIEGEITIDTKVKLPAAGKRILLQGAQIEVGLVQVKAGIQALIQFARCHSGQQKFRAGY